MNELSTETVNAVAEEIEAAVIELGKGINEMRIQQAWNVGKIISEFESSPTELIRELCKDPRMKRIKMGERSLWKAKEIFDMEPGSWEKLLETQLGVGATVNKLLALNAPEKPECAHPKTVQRCSSCGRVIH